MSMDVLLNGKRHLIDQGCTVKNLLVALDLNGRFAIEINQTIIPRSEYASTSIQSGDRVEVVQAIGGG